MGNLLELAANFIQMFIWTWFITKTFGFKNDNYISKIGFVVMWITAFAEISFINKIVVYDGFLTGIICLTYLIYAHLYLKGSFWSQIFVILFSVAIIFTIGSVTIFFFSFLTGNTTGSLIAEFTGYRVMMLIVTRVLEYLIFRAVVNINSEYAFTKKEWFLFSTMPALTWVTVSIITSVSMEAYSIRAELFYIVLIMVIINIAIFYFMYKIKKDTQVKHEYELLKIQNNNTKQTEINMKALYESTYTIKHDLEKHLLAIKTMAEKEKCDDIDNYVKNIIEHNINDVQKIVFTDNDIFNAIVNTKLELCRQKGIFPSINVSNEAVAYIKSSDIVVIFGNLFDNAIEAAEKTKKKIIILNVRLQGEYVSVYMENSFNEEYSNVELTTTKAEKIGHGFGVKNIKAAIEENEGMIQYFKNSDDMFCCDILMKKYAQQTKLDKNYAKLDM